MIESVPVAIALATGVATLAFFGAGALMLSLAEWLRKGKVGGPVSVLGRIAGVAAICLLPLAFLSVAGFLAAALADALGTPSIAFPFVSIAGIAGVRAAKDAGGGETAGCSRTIATFIACYVAIWGAAAWWATGGPAALQADLASLRWLQPPLAALPFSVALWRIAGRKRTAWLLFGSLAIMSAWFALFFFTVEAGFAAHLLPASDWLRFPLAAGAAALPLVMLPVLKALQTKGPARSRRLREVGQRVVPLGLLALPMGLAWAAARAAMSAL